jgi:hypothetical protein
VPSIASAPEPEPDETEFDSPRTKVSPRVSVGVEGGFWFAHPRPKTSVLPAVTEEAYASPQLAELQFEA